MSFSIRKNTYRCFVCGEHGGTIDLVMRYLKKDFLEACKWLANENNVIVSTFNSTLSTDSQLSTLNSKLYFDASRYEKYFARPWLSPEARRFLFDERKLDPRVVRWCRLTSWKDRNGTPWLQIPYYDMEGKLIGVQNRNLTPSRPPQRGGEDAIPQVSPWGDLEGVSEGVAPRFRFPSGSECGIYNLPVLKMLKPGDELWITEGCSDCWAMLSSGHKAIAIPSATLLSKKVVELLETWNLKHETTFHMWPDADVPGERLFLQLKEVLPNLVRHQLPNNCKDFSEFYLLKK